MTIRATSAFFWTARVIFAIFAVCGMVLILPGCSTPAPIAVDGFCVNFTEKDWTDPGLKRQNDFNLRADLANARVRKRQCGVLLAPK